MQVKKLSVQEYLSLGYIYLVVLGIISDVLYFKFLGIDILNYSTILDVLITPINIMVHDLKIPIYFSLTAGIGYFLLAIAFPRIHYKFRKKKWYRKLNNVEKLDQRYAEDKNGSGVFLIALLVFSMFLGFGIGRGAKMKSRLKTGDLKPNYKIVFSDQNAIEVKIVGQNSSYIFYVRENEKEISISPIFNNIKEIKRINAK